MTPPEVLALGRSGGAADTPGWTVRVVPNKFPAIPGQEVVVHGPAHVTAFAELSEAVVAEALRAWGLRREHHREIGAAYLLAAINEGPAAGASLDHSHSQLVPFDHVPPAVADEMPGFAAPCALCAAVADEEARTIRLEDGLRTFAPRWSRFAYELWIVPEEHAGEVAAPGAARPALLDATRRLRADARRRASRGTPSCMPRRCAATTRTTGTSRSGPGSRWPPRSSSARASG